jgi:hypothetical protein
LANRNGTGPPTLVLPLATSPKWNSLPIGRSIRAR